MKRYVVFTPEYQTYLATEIEPPEYGQDYTEVEAENKTQAKVKALRIFRNQTRSFFDDYCSYDGIPFKFLDVVEVIEEKEILQLTSQMLNEYCFNTYDRRSFPYRNFQAGSQFEDLFLEICSMVEHKSRKCLVETKAIENLLEIRSSELTEKIDLILDEHTLSVLSIQANDRNITLNEWINLILMKFCDGVK